MLARTSVVLLAGAILAARTAGAAGPEALPNAQQLRKLNARFAPVDLVADVSKLPENEKRALARIVDAARIMDPLFLRQVWSGNEPLLFELLGDIRPRFVTAERVLSETRRAEMRTEK